MIALGIWKSTYKGPQARDDDFSAEMTSVTGAQSGGMVRCDTGLEDSSQVMKGCVSPEVRTSPWGKWRIQGGFKSGQ